MYYDIITGKQDGAVKTVIYGPEGIGKSSLASKYPAPLFIDTEGSTKQIDTSRLTTPTTWGMLLQEIDFVLDKRPCETIIIDTIDWAEQMCLADLCAKNGKGGIEDFGYGNGWVYEKESFGKFLNKLTEVINAGINVVLIAHAKMRKFDLPDEMGSFDRWELKLGSKTTNLISPLVKEWADVVLFCNYKTMVIQTDKEGKKHKAQGNKRVMYTTHHPCWDAKNRYGLPEEIPMDYEQIRFIYEKKPTSPVFVPVHNEHSEPNKLSQPSQLDEPLPETLPKNDSPGNNTGIPKALADLMTANNVTEDMICRVCVAKHYVPSGMPLRDYPKDFVEGCLIGAWSQVLEEIKKLNGSNVDDGYPF